MEMELSRRQLLLTGGFVVAGAVLASCSSGESSGPAATSSGAVAQRKATVKDVVYAQRVQITSLATAGKQPQVYPAGYEAAFAIYSGLVRFDKDLNFEPDLATEWSTSDDDRTWTFTLRQGAKFHDGTPFNADAVVAYFTKMIDKTYNLSAYSLWSPIESTTKVDDSTVTVTTTKPYGALLNTLAHGSALIPSLALTAQGPDAAGLQPIGTGPYRVDTFEPGTKLLVTANSDYYGDAPIYESITYTYVGDDAGRVAAVQSGQANIIDAVPVQQAQALSSANGLNLIEVPGLQVFGVGMNQTNAILQDKDVRQALNLAVDVDAIIKALFRGYATPLDSPLAPKTVGHATVGKNTYDPEKAKGLLEKAGLSAGADGRLTKDGTAVNLRLRTPDGMYPNDTLVAQAIQEQLSKVGVGVTIQKVDKSTFWDGIKVAKEAVDFDLVLFGFNPSHGSGALQLDIMYRSNPGPGPVGGWNFNWYSNADVDELLTTALQTVEPSKQADVLAEAEKTIWDDAPYIWLYVPNNLTAYDSKAATPLVLPVVFTLPSRSASN
jgi:glutathione transport system substrate-binding protein